MAEIAPLLLSSIICERAIIDRVSGMPTIVNILQTINGRQFPIRYQQLAFFCELTNGHGQNQARVRLIDEEQNEKVLFEQEGKLEFKDVDQIVSLTINLHGVVFEHPGRYRFQIYCGGQLLGERRVLCRHVKPKNES